MLDRENRLKKCKGTDTIQGCGKGKPDTDKYFQRTKLGLMKVCRQCIKEHRDGWVATKRKYEASEETTIFNQLNKMMR